MRSIARREPVCGGGGSRANLWLNEQFGKPGHWGEASLYTNDSEHPLLAADTNGIWLHKWVWARTGPAFVYPSYWYTDNIWSNKLHHIFGNWNRFMADVPLNNSRYVDAAATSAHPRLRIVGQKDVPAGRAILWLDNRDHTWKRVVDRAAITAIHATVYVPMSRPSESYRVIWYNSYTGMPYRTNLTVANASGVVTLTVTGLVTDVAVKLQLDGESLWDGDGDGIPDQWEAKYVNRLETINAATDLDGDGMSDYAEWRADTHPLNADSYLRITDIEPESNAWRLTWLGGTNRSYRVYATDWMTSGSWTALQSAVNTTNAQVPQQIDSQQHFYRVMVE
jgi:hypothetical protein